MLQKIVLLVILCQVFGQLSFKSYSTSAVSGIRNPERGFANSRFEANLNEGELQTMGETILFRYYYLKEFKSSSISSGRLNQIRSELGLIRKHGKKLVIRFAYDEQGTDAPLNIVETHVKQLAPILNEFKDVLLTIQAGFIGYWGEWHDSSNKLSGTAVLNLLHTYFPSSVAISLRYPGDKIKILGGTTTTASEAIAFTSRKARTGLHNDCFLYNSNDRGTFFSTTIPQSTLEKFFQEDSKYVIIGGETCDTQDQNRFACPSALRELAKYHYTYLHWYFPFNKVNENPWTKGGCWNEIRDRFGYQLFIRETTLSHSVVSRSTTLRYTIKLENRGFAAPIRNRPINLVFSSGSSRYSVPLSGYPNLRTWLPGSIVISGSIAPSAFGANFNAMVGKSFDVSLSLPDPSLSLRGNPKYSIGFVNSGVYNPSTGLNNLSLKVSFSGANALDVEEDTLFEDSQ